MTCTKGYLFIYFAVSTYYIFVMCVFFSSFAFHKIFVNNILGLCKRLVKCIGVTTGVVGQKKKYKKTSYAKKSVRNPYYHTFCLRKMTCVKLHHHALSLDRLISI